MSADPRCWRHNALAKVGQGVEELLRSTLHNFSVVLSSVGTCIRLRP